MIDYVNGIDFPKSEWKRLTKTAIRDKFNFGWISRVKNDQQLTRFNMIHPSPDVALPWVLMRQFPLLRDACRLLAKLWAYSPNRYTTTTGKGSYK